MWLSFDIWLHSMVYDLCKFQVHLQISSHFPPKLNMLPPLWHSFSSWKANSFLPQGHSTCGSYWLEDSSAHFSLATLHWFSTSQHKCYNLRKVCLTPSLNQKPLFYSCTVLIIFLHYTCSGYCFKPNCVIFVVCLFPSLYFRVHEGRRQVCLVNSSSIVPGT